MTTVVGQACSGRKQFVRRSLTYSLSIMLLLGVAWNSRGRRRDKAQRGGAAGSAARARDDAGQECSYCGESRQLDR